MSKTDFILCLGGELACEGPLWRSSSTKGAIPGQSGAGRGGGETYLGTLTTAQLSLTEFGRLRPVWFVMVRKPNDARHAPKPGRKTI